MEQSTGRPATQIEVEAFTSIAKLQDENRELRLEIGKLKAEVERLQEELRISKLPDDQWLEEYYKRRKAAKGEK